MKTSFDHLPEAKREKLSAIAALFRERVPLGLLVLFGSHARGDWVEDPETGYKSDFDLLAVTHDPKQADDVAFWHELEDRFREIAAPNPLTLIVHSVSFVNREIRIGQYFFADIVNEGVALYDARHVSLARPKALNPQERLALGEQNFAYWFSSAGEFFRGCRYYAARGLLSHAAFSLHQAAERYFHAAALVLTGYKERSHDLEALGKSAAEQHPRLGEALPKTEPIDKHLFGLLKRAYIDARYSQSYRIALSELSSLQVRVLELAHLVRTVCLEKLASFCGPDAVSPSLPRPPAVDEPPRDDLPPPPDDQADLGRWVRDVAELADQRVRESELRGKEDGLREGKVEGLREGKVEGLREGEARGKAAALLTVLAARGLEVDDETRGRIEACSDIARLDAWLARAIGAASAREVIDDGGAPSFSPSP